MAYTIFLLLFLAPSALFSQANQAGKPKPAGPVQAVTPEQNAQIKKILSGYNAARLSPQDAKAIQEKFRQAGIHAGPETAGAIQAAGFDPEKLRNLAPPPNPGIKENAGPPSLDERMKRVEEIILKPLALTAAQKETANKAFRDFYVEMDKLGKAQPGATTPPDRSRMEPLEKARDAKIKQVISAAQYAKYLDLEKAARPPRPEGKSPGQK